MKMLIKGMLALVLLVSVQTAQSQAVSADSMKLLKQEKEKLALSQEINDQKIKLAEMENELKEKTANFEKAEAKAKKSADDNSEVASKLNKDQTDKFLSRKAHKASKSAMNDAKSARKSKEKLDDHKADMETLKKKIEANEKKLAEFNNDHQHNGKKKD